MNVVISPHFDDGIGSCGCLIYELVQAGELVELLTVFGGRRSNQISAFARKLLDMWNLRDGVAERIAEDMLACKRLGAKQRILPFIEALYRKNADRWLYPEDGDLFRSARSEDAELTEQIAAKLLTIYSKEDLLLFPGGRGKHVDHLLVKRAGERLLQMGYRVEFYREFSYEGEIDGINRAVRYRRFFPEAALFAKIDAMNAYSSQLAMLFLNADATLYFQAENIERGEIFEQYYRIES